MRLTSLLGLTVALLALAARSTPTRNEAGRQADGSPLVERSSPSSVKARKDIPPRTFNGKSQEATPKFSLEAGLSIFRMAHQGNANWAPQLLDSEGNAVELLANKIGKFEGEKAVRIPADGIYIIDVTANGPWTITVTR